MLQRINFTVKWIKANTKEYHKISKAGRRNRTKELLKDRLAGSLLGGLGLLITVPMTISHDNGSLEWLINT